MTRTHVPATARRAPHTFIAAGLIAVSLAYLLPFVPRGWLPIDDGMLGQAAERLLAGDVPHVDYQDPYTGGLSALHALVFRIFGTDLLHLRWLLYAGAALAQVLTYLILRRFLSPIGAAVASCVALGWSFPNYFASLPSWWVLVCALVCLWTFIKHVETGLVRYAAAAGLAAGAAILIKQTGLYILVALVISLLYGGGWRQRESSHWLPGRILCGSVAFTATALGVILIMSRPALADLLYMLLPILACSRVLLTADGLRPSLRAVDAYSGPMAAVLAAAAPLILFVAPYVVNGQLDALVNGLFILPQKRTQFASAEMPPGEWILAGIPLVALLMPLPAKLQSSVGTSRAIGITLGVGGIVLVATSLYDAGAYQAIWQSARALAALLPVVACALLLSDQTPDLKQRWLLFGCVTMLSWASLIQIPYSAPNYFCYVAPLAVIAAAAVASRNAASDRPALKAYAAVVLVFAVLIMNRGYVFKLGISHRPEAFTAPLDLDRAHLTVHPVHATAYRRAVDVITAHIGDGTLVAGPDSPEIYFLTGRFSPTGTFYDFFDGNVTADGAITDLPGWRTASVVVLNHSRTFSNGPTADFARRVRQEFPNADYAGFLEIRWR